jgi:hypothetical protein
VIEKMEISTEPILEIIDDFMDVDEPLFSTEEVDESSAAKDVKFEFLLVQLSQLEILLQRCAQCGRLPRGRGKPSKRPMTPKFTKRLINWTLRGTCATASWYCACKDRGKSAIRWSTQVFVEGTRMRQGNIGIAAAMTASPIDYPTGSAFAKAIRMPFLSRASFYEINVHYVSPVIESIFATQQSEIFARMDPLPLHLAIDGQFDSPGYCSELCRVTAIDVHTRLVLGFAVSHKSEVNGVSNAMELLGVKKVLGGLKKRSTIGSVTIDKNLSVGKYLRETGITFHYDLWHILKSLRKSIRTTIKQLSCKEEQKLMRSLQRRLFTHVWDHRSTAEDDPTLFKELVFTFFPHILGIHCWNPDSKFIDLVPISSSTKVSKGFQQFQFTSIFECLHLPLDENATPPIAADSNPIQKLLELLTKTAFLNDLARVKSSSATSVVESLHSVNLRYSPKRKYFDKSGFEHKTMLSILHFNTTQLAELEGRRQVIRQCQSYSKARGEPRTLVRKEVVEQPWKREMVENSIQRKLLIGQGLPDLLDERLEHEIEDLADQVIDSLLLCDDEEEETSEDELDGEDEEDK